MGMYLGYVEVKNNDFYNFKPTHKYENNHFELLTPQEREDLLPESVYGNINFYSSNREYDISEHFYNDQYIVFDFELTELDDNINSYGERNRTGYKVDVSKVSTNKFKKLSDFGYFRYIDKDAIIGDYSKDSILILTGNNFFTGHLGVINVGDALIGPYIIEYRNTDGQYYVNTQYKKKNYILPAFSTKEFENTNDYVITLYTSQTNYKYVNSNILEATNIDVISDEELLHNFRELIPAKLVQHGNLELSNLDNILLFYNKSVLSNKSINKDIQKSRLCRVKSIFTDIKVEEKFSQELIEVLSNLILKYEGSDKIDDLINLLVNNDQFMSKVQSFKIIKDKRDDYANQVKRIQAEIQHMKEESEKDVQIRKDELLAQYQIELSALDKEKKQLSGEIDYLKHQLEEYKPGVDLLGKVTDLKSDVDYYEKRKEELNSKLNEIEVNLEEIFKNSTEKAVKFSFDGMLANKMIHKAAEWEYAAQQENYQNIVTHVGGINLSKRCDNELIDYLCSTIAFYRPEYSKNSILNIFTCMTQNFLTIFSGVPGGGKTSICNIIAHILGLDKLNHVTVEGNYKYDLNRYIPVSVERGWTSKRDFIGYYNPLTKTFDRSNKKIFDGLNILDIEAKMKIEKLPFLVLLDEANLSPMEYYWADFMNICDGVAENSLINLGDDYQFQIPGTLRFVATINNDHTTESLSPRLLDRSWIITLPRPSMTFGNEEKLNDEDIEIISWDSLKNVFFDIQHFDLDGEAKIIYEKIVGILATKGIAVSPRSNNAIRKYWSVAQRIFESDRDYDTDASIVALDYAIAQKILPNITGNGDEYREFLEALKSLCSENNLFQSGNIIDDIIKKGNNNMGYYQFF